MPSYFPKGGNMILEQGLKIFKVRNYLRTEIFDL